MARPKSSRSLEGRIAARMKKAEGEVFASVQFLDLGTRAAVDQALSRLRRAGTIERAIRGLYYLPRRHALLGKLVAGTDEIVTAIARRDGLRLQEGGAHAANIMRLTEQVPARIIYDTDGPTRNVRVGGKLVIEFKHRSPRKMATAGRVTGMLISALANVGKAHITPKRLAPLRRQLKPEHKRQLLADLPLAPTWMHRHLRHIAAGNGTP